MTKPRLKIIIPLFTIIIIVIIVIINLSNMRMTTDEVNILNQNFESIVLKNKSDIVLLQNKVVEKIKHKYLSDSHSDLKSIVLNKHGFCYDRSIMLQKIFIYNKISIRPVFIFFSKDNKNTSYIDLFSKNIESHNIFEAKINNKWYVINTNSKLTQFVSLEDYLKNSIKFPKHTKFIRYLNNRNGRFIKPTWLPDIYFSV